MHAVFIPYGKKELVDKLIKEMEAQKLKLVMFKGKKTQRIWMDTSVRILPFGFMEYVFPKEYIDVVLTTLDFDKKNNYISKINLALIRKTLRLKRIPKFKKNQRLLWIKEHVTIIPLGIREDGEIIGKEKFDKGWKHEAI